MVKSRKIQPVRRNKPAVVRRKVAPKKKQLPKATLYQKIFFALSACVLLLSTLLWSYFGARVNMINADHLIDVYILQPGQATGAIAPSQHTFLLKWPFFWLASVLGPTDGVFITLTMLFCLLTVGFIAFIVFKIIRDIVRTGVLFLIMSSLFLVIPIESYPGALLPVGMAMLTTRNLEYVLYIASLLLILRLPIKFFMSWRFWFSVVIGALLIASDKLFLPLYIGGAVLLFAFSFWLKHPDVRRFSTQWVALAVPAAIGGQAVLFGVGQIVQLTGQESVQPYGFVTDAHLLIRALLFGVMGILTNLGANPASSAGSWFDIPEQAVMQLTSIKGLAYVMNAAIIVTAIIFAIRLFRTMAKPRTKSSKKQTPTEWPLLLLLALVMSSIVSVGIFVVTNHDYAVDARYLQIITFTFIVGLAVILRNVTLSGQYLRGLAVIGVLGISSAVAVSVGSYSDSISATSNVAMRNGLVASAMKAHGSDRLAGNYWRVVPTKQAAKNTISILPLSGCTQIRGGLTNSNWQVDLSKKSFAYLLTSDGQSANFPQCTASDIIATYGKPNQSIIVSGTVDNPKEQLLFYDGGTHHNDKLKSVSEKKTTATVSPLTLKDVSKPACSGKNILSVVAHQDDDLLFMNPDHMHEYENGACLRTVFLTAGDAGQDQFYWLGREKGAEAAYEAMSGSGKLVWIYKTIMLAKDTYITIANPYHNTRISLIFVRLPDGNPLGGGFASTGFENLERLESGGEVAVRSVDKQSSYTKASLIEALEALMKFYSPDEVHTQTPVNLSERYRDHSDHLVTGRFAQQAFAAYKAGDPNAQSGIRYYTGYPIHGQPPNVSPEDAHAKADLFYKFSQFDPGACPSEAECSQTVYPNYFDRQYEWMPPAAE